MSVGGALRGIIGIPVPEVVVTAAGPAWTLEGWFQGGTWTSDPSSTPESQDGQAMVIKGGLGSEYLWWVVDGLTLATATSPGTETGVSYTHPREYPAIWHYLAAFFDGSGECGIYVDGGLDNTASFHTGATPLTNGDPLWFGYNPNGFSLGQTEFWNGKLCRMAFYNVALDAGTVAAHYAASGSGYDAAVEGTAGLVSYWPLNETSGTTANDVFGPNNGTYIGGHTLAASGPSGVNAVLLDGTSGYVEIPDDPSLSPL